jgi:hypothetical protein
MSDLENARERERRSLAEMRPEVRRLLQELGAAETIREAEDLWWAVSQLGPFEEIELEAVTDAIAELASKGGFDG